ncbi:hypothetical protein SDC9_169588 [bioreactor metagenome]|uniref:Uncharacterized protein n=1 Tax=bioreactor metagenome TaxID=1076179 RepID=A0A645G6C3_9ZZZZ
MVQTDTRWVKYSPAARKMRGLPKKVPFAKGDGMEGGGTANAGKTVGLLLYGASAGKAALGL